MMNWLIWIGLFWCMGTTVALALCRAAASSDRKLNQADTETIRFRLRFWISSATPESTEFLSPLHPSVPAKLR